MLFNLDNYLIRYQFLTTNTIKQVCFGRIDSLIIFLVKLLLNAYSNFGRIDNLIIFMVKLFLMELIANVYQGTYKSYLRNYLASAEVNKMVLNKIDLPQILPGKQKLNNPGFNKIMLSQRIKLSQKSAKMSTRKFTSENSHLGVHG